MPHPSRAAPTHALAWLNLQADEVLDACLVHLPDTDLAHFATAYRQATDGLAPPGRRSTQALAHRLANQCHLRLRGAPASGPWIERLVQAPHGLEFDAQDWATMHAQRQTLRPKLDVAHAHFLEQDYAPHLNVPQGNTAAILAFDALSRGAMTLPLDHAHPVEEGTHFCPLPLKEAGAQALTWATFFEPCLQDTLIAQVIVGTALGFVGETAAAERWLNLGLLQNIDGWLDPTAGDRSKTFYGLLRRHQTMPEESLAWLDAAALATGSTVLLGSTKQARGRARPSFAALSMAHTRHPHWPLMTLIKTSSYERSTQALWAKQIGFAALAQALTID